LSRQAFWLAFLTLHRNLAEPADSDEIGKTTRIVLVALIHARRKCGVRMRRHTTGRPTRLSSCQSQLAVAPVSKPIRTASGARVRSNAVKVPGSDLALPSNRTLPDSSTRSLTLRHIQPDIGVSRRAPICHCIGADRISLTSPVTAADRNYAIVRKFWTPIPRLRGTFPTPKHAHVVEATHQEGALIHPLFNAAERMLDLAPAVENLRPSSGCSTSGHAVDCQLR
jgi:hypothetical protein